MVIKSFIILSILFNLVGANNLATKFDDAVIRDRSGAQKVAVASDLSLSLPNLLPTPKVSGSETPYANSERYLLADLETGKVLAKQDYKTQVPIASTTKIMSAIIALESYKLDDIVTVSPTAASQIPSVAYLRVGERITVENLLNCMLIPSGNDAAYAIAEHMSGDKDGTSKFVDKMNEKAKELGMVNTRYEDPAGLNSNGYSTAYDLFLVTRYALKNTTFREIVGRSSYTAKNIDSTIYHSLKQSNRLVTENYLGAIGVKTGFTDDAGHCIVGAATRDGHTLVAVILKTYSTAPPASAEEAERLITWGFNNISWD